MAAKYTGPRIGDTVAERKNLGTVREMQGKAGVPGASVDFPSGQKWVANTDLRVIERRK
ncbi:MAG: hypothetical protein L0I76_26825 [Pseudonocardia sp.]|nr:hypothetical protein [Pseudonocardia sp.]